MDGNQINATQGVEESRFKRLVDSIEDYAIFMMDPEGMVTSWNAGALRIKGYTKEEVLGKYISIFYVDEAVLENKPAIELDIAARNGRFEDEGWRRRKDGSRFWANVVITALYDSSGELEGYAKITKDMTDRKRMEERFRRVVESAPNAMVMVNARGRIEMVNTQAEHIFGYKRDEMLGQHVEVLVPDKFRHGHPEKREKFYHEPQSRPMGAGRDLFGRRKDGSEFPVEIGLNPIETEEGLMVLSAIVDISDRKHKESLIQAALKEKDLLLGEIHHRVKNNLQIVHSLLDLQLSRINDPAVQDMLMDSQNRVRTMALIHQTLYQSNDFARVDFGGFLDALLPALIASYGIDSGRIKFKVDVNQVYLPINTAIPCGLLLNELMTNAMKHAFPDGREGVVELYVSDNDNGTVQLVVSDDGIGIAEDMDIERTETLGLSLVNLLSQQLVGNLIIQRCNPTRFTLEFPVSIN